jgi:2-(1,2-epoxy-1,2-dihydrophenyl)acetyl-CoA isomerase
LNLDGWTGLKLTRPRPGVLLVVLDRPERLNTLTAGMKRDLVELCTHIQADDETRAVVVTGAGKAFCAGDLLGNQYRTEPPGSVPALPGGHQDAESTYVSLRAFSHALNRAVRSLDKITIAAINGAAIQSGLSLALACDFRIASQAARLGSGTLRFGLMPDEGGHWLVLQHMGIGAAIDFLLRARIVDATDALARGLVNEVVPDERLTSAALDLAEELLIRGFGVQVPGGAPVLTWGFTTPGYSSCPFCPHVCSMFARAHGPSNPGLVKTPGPAPPQIG